MLETPQAGAPCTPSSSRQARCEHADDMDSVPSQAPQQQPSPPPYPHESIRDQSMDDGRPFNPPFHSIRNMQNMQNMFDHYFEYPSASQESDLIVSGLEHGFYQACAQFFYVSSYPLETVHCRDSDMGKGSFYTECEWRW
jgi:hypothetical protein